jgi:alkanesulfonate monooxygenase
MQEEVQKLPELFSTCPPSSASDSKSYLDRVAAVARWSEEYGCTGILVYADHSLVDPWLVSQVVIQNTKNLCPLVAVQPIYMHPYSVAKMVASLGFLFGRRVCLNMVAGGFKNDLLSLNDCTPHDHRYTRLTEYTTIIKQLLSGPEPVTYEGEFYRVDKLKMTPPLPAQLFPRIFVSGSSQAGLDAARALGATAVKYPKPAKDCEAEDPLDGIDPGVRVGIIAREQEEKAWQIAEQRFPEDRKGQITHQLAMKVTDSLWHHQLSGVAAESRRGRTVYWLRPFENYKTFCPYLVGSYHQVGGELARYLALGYRTFILDVPPNREELRHIQNLFGLAVEKSKSQRADTQSESSVQPPSFQPSAVDSSTT